MVYIGTNCIALFVNVHLILTIDISIFFYLKKYKILENFGNKSINSIRYAQLVIEWKKKDFRKNV